MMDALFDTIVFCLRIGQTGHLHSQGGTKQEGGLLLPARMTWRTAGIVPVVYAVDIEPLMA